MDRKNQCGIYRLFKLSKGVANTFTHDFKKLERDLHVVNHDYADLINKNSVINGSLYEYDEKASELYWAKKPFKNEIKEEKVVEKEEETIDEELELLKIDYEELSGKKAHHLATASSLKEKIEKLKK